MNDRTELLARAVAECRVLAERFFVGFDDSNRTRQAPGMPNHAAWQLGHMALYLHRAAERLEGGGLPESDFVMGDGRGGGADRFDTESICFASTPVDDPGLYPGWERCVEIFRAAAARLERAAREADEALLDRPVPWGNGQSTGAMVVVRMVFHTGTHAGQLVDLRRGLGMAGVIG